MKEQLIDFETAKLAKEKGFKHNSICYDGSGEIMENINSYTNNYMQRFRYEAPTQSLLQKWLREEHGIWVTVIPEFKENHPYYTLEGKQIGRDKYNQFQDWHTIKIQNAEHNLEMWHTNYNFEEALEKGLLQALKLIDDE